MSQNDVSQTVNSFMLRSAPTLVEATPMGYDILKSVASNLLFYLKTSREHATYAMNCKYGHIYTNACIVTIINEAIADEVNQRMRISQVRREKKIVAGRQSQPVLLSA